MKKKFNPKHWQGRRKDQVESNYWIVNISIGVIAVILMGSALVSIIKDIFRGIFW
jgi:hypothetical protein